MKLTKIAIAAAAFAATLSGGLAVAGSFQTNATVIAREVIVSDAQLVTAPQVSYSFQGPVRNPAQETYFQIQLKLDSGSWTVPTSASFPQESADPVVDNIRAAASNGNVALVTSGGLVIATANAVRVDDRTIKATFRVPKGPGENNARVVFNAAGTHALGYGLSEGQAPAHRSLRPAVASELQISNLKSVVGDVVDCDNTIKNITGSITQYPDITDPTFTATAANNSPASEHLYPGSQNSGPVTSFPTNLRVVGTPDALIAVQNYSDQGRRFQHQNPTTTPNVSADGLSVNLGTVEYHQAAQGYDIDLTNVYGSPPTAHTHTKDYAIKTVADDKDGLIELKDFTVALTGSFAESAKFWLEPQTTLGEACAATAPAGAVSPSGGSAVINYTGEPFNKGTQMKVCYGVDGKSVIPTTAISAHIVMTKASDGKSASDTDRRQEQNNSCSAQYNVGGGIRIDVRNYASYAKFGDSGTSSTLRIINNSETATADLYAQMIYADGTYGAWGKLPDLKPRAAANYSNRELEAFMTNAAAAANPFGNNAAEYAQTGGSTVSAHTKAGVGDRVRIVSTTGSTLRVQSYISSGPVMIDTSGAQGVDFEGLAAPQNGRAPTKDGQPISQDAVNGLSRR